MPFKPTVGVNADGPKATDSPEPVPVELGLPYEKGKPEGITNSYLKTAKVTVPEGMGINPSSATGLVACTDAQFGKGTNNSVACPADSKIGTVTVETPSLPAGSIGGAVMWANHQKWPWCGGFWRTVPDLHHASGPERGVNVRLVGKVFPNLVTGQLTAIVEENPEAPFNSFQVHFNGGAKGTLTTPGASVRTKRPRSDSLVRQSGRKYAV